MFDFTVIGSLLPPDAADAIVKPARAEGAVWEREAVDLVVNLTRGYPYFLQEFGKQAWDMAPGPRKVTRDDVEASVQLTLAELDSGFFRVRVDRTTDAERMYLRAMAELGPGPHQSSRVAEVLGRDTRQAGPTRDSLIKRGLCYSPRWGQIDFTVPMFDEFIRRWIPKI